MNSINADQTKLPKIGRFEFVVRFVCGAILGVFASLRLVFILYHQPLLLLIVTVGLISGCGFGAAKYGDRFWHAIFDR